MSSHGFCYREFRPRNFGLDHKRPILFVTPQFGPKKLYPVWTVLLAVYHVTMLAVDGYLTSDRMGRTSATYLTYLSRWCYFLLTIATIVDAMATVYVFVNVKYILEERESNKSKAEVIMRNKAVLISYNMVGDYYKIKWYMKVSWLLFTLSTVCGLTSSLIFWTLHFQNLLPKLYAERLLEDAFDFGSVVMCAVNSFVILINLWVTAKPFRILHLYMPIVFYFIYLVFTVVYQSVSDEPLYQATNWSDFFLTIGPSVGVVIVVVPLVHLLVYLMVQARTLAGTWCHIQYRAKRWSRQVTKVSPVYGT